MLKPVLVKKNPDNYDLFTMKDVLAVESAPLQFRDITCNNFELAPHCGFAPQTHDDKLEVVTAVPIGKTEGPIVRYSDEAGGYAIELEAYDSIIIPRGLQHKAQNLCEHLVVLIITNFSYED